jgi:hypothetical protein
LCEKQIASKVVSGHARDPYDRPNLKKTDITVSGNEQT